MRRLYSLFLMLCLPFIFLRLWWRGRHVSFRAYRHRWLERLAIFKTPLLNNTIWIHAVSFGEVVVATPLVRAIQKAYPGSSIVITTMTITGSNQVQKQFKPGEVFHVYVPYDISSFIKRFLKKIKPRLLILIETELWPNKLHYCQQYHIPVLLANARLSEKSFRSYQRIKKIIARMLSSVSIIAAQAQDDANRFIALGMPADKTIVTGSIKFDINDMSGYLTPIAGLKKQCGDRLVWIAASTHAGEDEIILAAHQIIRKTFPEALLILVPRHPERFNSVVELCRKEGFSVVRRSECGSAEITADIYVGNTMGEMMIMFGAADVAFVGGSFMPVGGHNMLESAALSKPIITGPHTFNFSEVTNLLLDARALVRVDDVVGLSEHVLSFFSDEILRKNYGERALAVVQANRGALEKHMHVIRSLLG